MALAAWWRGDVLPELSDRSGFAVSVSADDERLAALNRVTVDEVRQRRQQGNVAYIAEIDGVQAAYGWVARISASIGELELRFSLPAWDRYLWDFATLPQWQGLGVYPRLLQAIIRAEDAERFWIVYAPENLPSGAGIAKAGFRDVGQLSFERDGTTALYPLGDPARAAAGAALFGVPAVSGHLLPCWRCERKAFCVCQRHPEACVCAAPVRPSRHFALPIAN